MMTTERKSKIAISGWRRWILIGMAFTVLLSLVFFLVVGVGGYLYCKPRYDMACTFDLKKLDRGIPIQNRVPLSEISSHFINALIAAEDPGFFDHKGVDYKRIGKAVWQNYRSTEIQQGASTLTQMLVRASFDDELDRFHVLEPFLAQRVERVLDKQQILELYINRTYFGDGYYGIGAAANGYFGKPPKALSVTEAATLAGVIRNPYFRSPKLYPEAAKKTRDYVLTLMQEQGFIDLETMKLAQNRPVVVK